MRWRAGCILEAKASEVMTTLLRRVQVSILQLRDVLARALKLCDLPNVPEMSLPRRATGHGLVMGVQVGVVVDFERRRVEGSRDLFSCGQ
jgi:hypothetical protein